MNKKECSPSFDDILDRYNLKGASVCRVEEGLINKTFRVHCPSGRIYILQKVNPVFPLSVNRNIDFVTQHLLRQGMLSPAILRTLDDSTEVTAEDGVWRMLTYIDGVSEATLSCQRGAFEAGRLVSSFHSALVDPPAGLDFHDLHLLDMAYHTEQLLSCEAELRRHRRYDYLAPLVESLLEYVRHSERLPDLSHRICHGDLKISNVIFDKTTYRALCLIDLDTIGPNLLPLELGDAMRSWCNPVGEDLNEAQFDTQIFAAAIDGYASVGRDFIEDVERASIATGIENVCLTLALRFCVDAVREDYFGWDNARFSSHSEHSQVRSESQLSLFQSVRSIRSELERVVERAFLV
ncbi:phosphotransferase [Haliea sp. E1-2-M8]|uniref:phosphotransferase enzyme family protein n=1 Tax=Haliea sp. E1-2-M8 TaxID=3064706 RepID=UPI0027256191|nr:phosphotransferase [Haliea sp. E1-2-M8]MDO8863832.1 phosphotransferase [Haliea sp. E1-2-M8]